MAPGLLPAVQLDTGSSNSSPLTRQDALATDDARDGFDAQAILATVDAWKAPDDWHIYRTQKGYFLTMGIFNIIFASLMGAMSVVMIVILFITLHSGIGQTDLATCMFP